MNRAQRRANKPSKPSGYHRMTKEQRMEALVKNGITPSDLEKAFEDGRRECLKVASDHIMKTAYAAICLALHDLYGFGQKRCMDVLVAVDRYICNTFTGTEAVEEVFDRIGLLIDFKDPDGSVQAKEQKGA